MTRQAFMARLREGLRGLPPQAIADILADYETHFAEGEAAGRTEDEVAAALGDPDRLARELRAESQLARWREERSPSSAAAAIFAVLGLGALDLMLVLPFAMGILAVLFGCFVACVGGFVAGGAIFAAAPFGDPPGGVAAAMLFGVGVMAGSGSGLAICTLVGIGLVSAAVWYGRLHYRLLKPALEA
jgi:uncharacterized membrane protein